MSWHMSPRYGMWYWSVVILFWQLSIDHFVNGQYKRCGFKTRLRNPSLAFDSLPYPTRRRERTYARSVTWQPNEKRLTIFYEYGALFHARFANEGAPLKIVTKWREIQKSKLNNSLTNWVFEFFFFHISFYHVTFSKNKKSKSENKKHRIFWNTEFYHPAKFELKRIKNAKVVPSLQLFACVLAQRAIFGN